MPVLGWCWKFSEFVFLERSYEKDKEIINTQIKELAEHPDPMWVSHPHIINHSLDNTRISAPIIP